MTKIDSNREANVRDPQTYAIIGAAMEVHRILGMGFLEPVYQDALEAELELRAIPFCRAPRIAVHYKDRILECWYEPDFVCFGEVIVELKALDAFCGAHEAQVINYLKATGYGRGLLLNFGTESLEYRRLVFTARPSQT